MKKTRSVILLLAAVILTSCGADGFESEFAPTGARGATDEFGRNIYLDEECGGLDDPDYPDYFQNALLRDGDVHDGKIWLVDGSHLWSASLPGATTGDTEVRLEKAYIGHGNAVATSAAFLAVALVEGGLVIYPEYDFSSPVYVKDAERVIDLDVKGETLVVAAGRQGILVYDLYDPHSPVLTSSLETGGYASGARWGTGDILYFAACSVVGYVDFSVTPLAPNISADLDHRNAKDAHGNAERLIVANNGGGVWFFGIEDLVRNSVYELLDPNFYANAAYVKDDFAYVAAGNREIVALSMQGNYEPEVPPEPEAVLPKDPLGITVSDDIVYGFGNFRDVGERTVVRTTALDGTRNSVLDFGKGLLNWVEPHRYALRLTEPGGKEWLVRRELYGYGVYNALPGDAQWTRDNAYKFYFSHASYSVEVTADNIVRTSFSGATESTIIGQWPASFPARGRVEVLGTVLSIYDEENLVKAFSLEFETGREPMISIGFSILCQFENTEEEGGASRTTIGGAYQNDDQTVRWCSRLIDPYKPANREAADFGTMHQVCLSAGCLETEVADSGTVGILPLADDRWLSLVDDRIAYTASIVEWVPKVAPDFEAESTDNPFERIASAPYRAEEQVRRVFFGRPEGWSRQDDGSVRVWMTDGSVFSYHPESRTVTNRIQPLEQ